MAKVAFGLQLEVRGPDSEGQKTLSSALFYGAIWCHGHNDKHTN